MSLLVESYTRSTMGNAAAVEGSHQPAPSNQCWTAFRSPISTASSHPSKRFKTEPQTSKNRHENAIIAFSTSKTPPIHSERRRRRRWWPSPLPLLPWRPPPLESPQPSPSPPCFSLPQAHHVATAPKGSPNLSGSLVGVLSAPHILNLHLCLSSFPKCPYPWYS